MTQSDIQAAKQRLGIVGTSPALLEAVGRALRVAPIDLSVLVIGESGTGKEFFPKLIHSAGARKHSPYIAVNCGAIPEGTIDSELFGHEKGAFTGAVASRKGYFEEANGGTIFLDEVAELPLTTQARLLRVLETGEFMKVGSSQVQKTNIRIVAATNVDMAKAVADGRFREDLYYRLSTVQINVPPLRERGSDILLLAKKFAADFAEKYSTPELELTDSARALLQAYRWPGNVRQLKNVVEQLALFEADRAVGRERLEQYLPQMIYAPTVASAPAGDDRGYARERDMLFNLIFSLRSEVDELRQKLGKQQGEPLVHFSDAKELTPTFTPYVEEPKAIAESAASPRSLEDNEREMIRESLERNGGRRKQTAQELNISERTLYRKIRDYGLE
ncbi:MAG: sigma-54 dependent transcriptional regulator [Bacteroides sp.]|nr:sigma-54 dependent transcriptional regulator [Bacteroides sp.]MCM1379049.1 sigma-54 dependent transcriptional regulator [Bacteroides sp.]MCM1445747.1 sigma-54 dependent transcriptional regulator [Prevotella sp.]